VGHTSNPATLDTSVANDARIYDYWLGGKDNFAADREAAELLAAAVPQLPWLSRENRKFLGRAVRFCANAGITQFLDVGSGLPTMENVHEVAEQVAADPRVVYADNDPVVVRHAQALLATPRTVAVYGDLTRPDEILDAPGVRRMIDLGRPLAVLLISVLHFIPDEAGTVAGVARLRDAMAPGSYLVISHIVMPPGHVTGHQPVSETARKLGEARKGMPSGAVRTREEVAAFFGDFTLVDPGLKDVWAWRPEGQQVLAMDGVMTLLGGVARKG
jgi:S-adenosyl methyltransferase